MAEKKNKKKVKKNWETLERQYHALQGEAERMPGNLLLRAGGGFREILPGGWGDIRGVRFWTTDVFDSWCISPEDFQKIAKFFGDLAKNYQNESESEPESYHDEYHGYNI